MDDGIDVSIKEVPDHISIELEFMYYLISEEISAIHDGADDRLQDVRNKQLYFLNEFLCRWISQFCSAVSEHAQTDFYKSLSNVTETFIFNDLTLLEQEVENLAVHSKGMADLAKIVPNVFPEGSGVAKSEALPEIWENPGDFKAAIDKFVEAANNISAAANDGDAAAIGPAMNALGQSCKGCHDNFREEHD